MSSMAVATITLSSTSELAAVGFKFAMPGADTPSITILFESFSFNESETKL